ncbi:MAG: hypothetical protein J6A89_00070 [Clostridia bacterium]|nr:hypothetical protein [Clostridia bacterium]
MKNKETLFSKNNYDIQLEEILENKKFDDEAKSLILNILYKIDIAYKDYFKTKIAVKLKSEIIADIIDIIENNCDTIQIVNPKNAKNKFSVDKKNKLIKVFPNEVYLLQALYYMKTVTLKRTTNIFDKAIMTAFNKGKAINDVEIIRDFNGWSWNNAIDNKISKYYNLIYQDLFLVLGNEVLNNLLTTDNIRENLMNKIDEIYGEKKANELSETIEKCCILIYMNNSDKNKNEVLEYLTNKESELKEVSNKAKYISKITIENNENMQIISKIDTMLKNKVLIEKEFSKTNIKEKYGTIEKYQEYLKNIKKQKLDLINSNTNLINPFEYVKRKKQLEREVQILKNIIILSEQKNSIYTSIIELQRKTISCFYKKIEVYDLKKELVNLVYEVRYYNYLPIEKDKKIKDLKELYVDIRNVQKKLIHKLSENKVVDLFANDYNINYEILKYIFITKMMNINKIQIKLKKANKKLIMEYYDEKTLETELSINFEEDDFNELTKKTDKKIRIFI